MARADRVIETLAVPPDYIIAISLGERLDHVPGLDLVAERVTELDLGKLARRLLDGLETGLLTLENIAEIAAKIGFPRHANYADVWLHFNWITDEADLIDHGTGDPTQFRDGVIAALRKAAAVTNR